MLKPFDLQKALAGYKVVTRNGYVAREFHFFAATTDDNLYGIVVEDGERVIRCWYPDGRYYRDIKSDSNYDLFMDVDVRYVNIYLDEGGAPAGSLGKWTFHGYGYPTKEMAENTSAKNCLVATVEIEIPKEG